MNVEALLIFGKVVAVLALLVSTIQIIRIVSAVYEHNRSNLSIMLHGIVHVKWGFMTFLIVLVLLSTGFLVGTCGV